jgi:DNA-binding NtrC family response regulator
VHVVMQGAIAIGRGAGSAIVLTGDVRASRCHATIELRGGELTVRDERSRNGTFVNGARHERAPLADGDVLEIGDSFLVVRREARDADDAELPGLSGVAPAMRALRVSVRKAAPTNATVLLLAASGCGKELTAHALHAASGRTGPFIPVNCAAIPLSLAESQLFGHVAGAFTGAQASPGLFRSAEQGTLFLDEVGELTPELQPKLLRVLQERTVLPVGATRSIPCDVRIIAATNQDLSRATSSQVFRGDLYARLAELCMTVPTLAERREDILPLFVGSIDDSFRVAPALARALLLDPWPFNVRELLAVAQTARIRAAGPLLELSLVEDRLRMRGAASDRANDREPAPPPLPAGRSAEPAPPPDRSTLVALLREHGGVVADIARAVGRSRKQVYRWLKQHDLDPTDHRRD